MKVLVIEDDRAVSDYITKSLREEGHTADAASSGKDGLFLGMTEKYDVMIIDRMLPQVEGVSIIRALRAAGNATPILILSALGEVDDRVLGLRSGGDDYLVKPFSFAELSARLDIMHRRHVQAGGEVNTTLSCGDIEVDLLSHKVRKGGKALNIQGREFRLLEYLLRNKGRVVTRTMLLENVWDYHFDPQTNVIDVHISRLRGKLDGDDKKSIIKTVRGAGYIVED